MEGSFWNEIITNCCCLDFFVEKKKIIFSLVPDHLKTESRSCCLSHFFSPSNEFFSKPSLVYSLQNHFLEKKNDKKIENLDTKFDSIALQQKCYNIDDRTYLYSLKQPLYVLQGVWFGTIKMKIVHSANHFKSIHFDVWYPVN